MNTQPDTVLTAFHYRLNGGSEQIVETKTGLYIVAAVAALAQHDCVEGLIEIWIPHLAPEYGPYTYKIERDEYGRLVCGCVHATPQKPEPSGERLVKAAEEALAISRGEKEPARETQFRVENGRALLLRSEDGAPVAARPSPSVEGREDLAEKILAIGHKNKWALTEKDEDTISEWFTGSKSVPPSWWTRAADNLCEAFVENDIPLGPLAPQEMQPLDVGQKCEAYIATIPYPASVEAVDVEGTLRKLNEHHSMWSKETSIFKEAHTAITTLRSELAVLSQERDYWSRHFQIAADKEGSLVKRLTLRATRLEKALKEIAGQKITDEWHEDEGGDVEFGYDSIILRARAALGEG